jgi:GntR family transcriptional regulator/MocR family aminotransferase
MYPGLRMSYLVVPQSLAQSFSSGLNQLFRPGQLSLQAAMSDFITEGYFASHVRRMRGIYAERQRELKRSLDSHFRGSIQISGGNAGLHLTTRFNNPVDISRMTSFCDSKGVALRDLSLYYQGKSPMAGYVLGYGGIATDQVEAAVQIMAQGYDLATR